MVGAPARFPHPLAQWCSLHRLGTCTLQALHQWYEDQTVDHPTQGGSASPAQPLTTPGQPGAVAGTSGTSAGAAAEGAAAAQTAAPLGSKFALRERKQPPQVQGAVRAHAQAGRRQVLQE